MKIAVVGAGGIGGYFGGRWAEAGIDVTLIARGSQLEAIRAKGLRIFSPLGDADVRPKVTDRAGDVGEVDFVLLATKAWQLDEALGMLPPMLGSSTLVLGLQNGVDAAGRIAAAVGENRTLGGTCRIISFIDAPGVIRHAAGSPTIIFGEVGGGTSARAEALRDVIAKGKGYSVQLVDDVQQEIWRKFHWFAPLAGVGSVTRSPAGSFRSLPETRKMLISAMDEVYALARAVGVHLAPDETYKAMQFVDSLPPDATSTMMRDFRDGKRTELETLNGAITRMGAQYGVPTPVNSLIYAALLPVELSARRSE